MSYHSFGLAWNALRRSRHCSYTRRHSTDRVSPVWMKRRRLPVTQRAWETAAAVVLALGVSAVWVGASASPSTTTNLGGGGGPPRTPSFVFATNPVQEDNRHGEENVDQPPDNKRVSGRRRIYDVSARAIQGVRVTMEDEYFVAGGGYFAAVFDGHGGGGVSRFLKRHLYRQLTSRLKALHQDEREASSHPQNRPSLACHAAALREAFGIVEDAVLGSDELHYQGSTAVAVAVHETEAGHRTILSANVGDSRAILSRHGQAVDLTRDHKPNDNQEKARIMAMGETIEWDRLAKVHRVRNLSLSRAIGDRYAKPVISGEVEIKHFPVMDDGDEFVLLASDGLWDVMTSQDVVDYVHEYIHDKLEEQPNMTRREKERYQVVLKKRMAKHVAFEAYRRGSGDNICVVMVWLDKEP